MKTLSPHQTCFCRNTRKTALAAGLFTCMIGMQTASAGIYTWANTNVLGATPTPTLDWFSGGSNPKGAWIGGTPVTPAGYWEPVNFFQDNTTPLGNTSPSGNSQIANLNNNGIPFQLRILKLSGKASDTPGANLAMTLSGDPIHFSNTSSPTGGSIYMDGVNNVQTLSYNVSHPLIIGTTAKNSATLTLLGSGSAEVVLSGPISEIVESGGKIVKQGPCAVTLSGDSAISRGLDVLNGTIRLAGQNTSGTNKLDLRRGNVVFDLATGNDRWSGGTAVPVPTFNGGTLTVKGAPTGDSSQTLAGPTANYVQSKIIVDPNGGTSTTLNLGDTWIGDYSTWGILFIDRSAPGAVVRTTTTNVNDLIVWSGNSGRLGIIVKDSTGFGFPTVIDGEVRRYAGASQLQANSHDGNISFKTSGNLTLTTGSHSMRTLELDTSTVAGDLNLNTKSIGGALLTTGGHDYTIRNGSYTGNLLHHFGTGTLTIDAACTIGLRKTGPGRVILNGMNTFLGEFKGLKICDGVVQAVDGVGLPTTQALYLIGGVFQSGGVTFTRTVSLATPYDNKVTWRPTSTGDNGRGGGFAAQGGTFTIALNAGAALEWATGAFVQNDQALILGSSSADNLLDWQNGINLGSALPNSSYPSGSWVLREIQVDDNPSSVTDIAQISGALTGSVGGLLKTGDGTLRLTAANTYNGPTYINGGTLLVNGSLNNAVEQVMVNAGGTLGGSGIINRPVTVYAGATLNGSLGLTCGSNVTLKNNAKLFWDAGATGKVTVNGVLTLPSTASAVFGAVLAAPLVLFESPSPIVGSIANWTVTPSTVTLTLSEDGKQVIASDTGVVEPPLVVLPDANNPDYLYCDDFESGLARPGHLPLFSITGRNGVREGAGWKSGYGYSNVLTENNGIPPYPTVQFPRYNGILFVQYMVKVPANFYLGRSDHGYYVYDSALPQSGNMAVVDHATDHPLWLNPEWDPHSINNLRGSSYNRMIRSFEGFEPARRGQWHSYQVMIVPSQKDPAVGRMKVWVDGVLANFCKHDTIPTFNTFWISNYWHSWEYVPKDTVSNVFESHTAPPHPAFEILLDNLIVSKSFVEFGPNKPQVERIRLTNLQSSALTLRFDSTVAASSISVIWGEEGPNWRQQATTTIGTVTAPGYFHTVNIAGLTPGKRYAFVATVEDTKGRHIESEPVVVATRATSYPDLTLSAAAVGATGPAGAWKGEAFTNRFFGGAPAQVRSFESLSYIAWPGVDSELGLDTTRVESIRYSKRAFFLAGSYVFRFGAADGVRITFDGVELYKKVARTQGRLNSGMIRKDITAGEHDIVIEHTLWREADWEAGANKSLAFCILPGPNTNAPTCYAHDIYNTRFYKPEEPCYSGRWSTEVETTIQYGETTAYGKTATGSGRVPYIKLGVLEVGKTYHWRATAVDGLGNTTVTPDATFVCGDTMAPRKILCSLKRLTSSTLELSFGAPGEDGRHGQATAYDIRWSNKPLNVTNWGAATRMPSPPTPQPSGVTERIVLQGLASGTNWYVAVSAIDQIGQASLLSNIVSDPAGPQVMDCDGDGYGVGSLLGPDPDDYDPMVPVPQLLDKSPRTLLLLY